ncbi:PINIT domain-containing protein [Irpex rosettiformis]|uniref:PINIT domain-containing protein n=1 Tax=Irpex rosettiformis TaxID=378272 RepID=A0ACB8UKH2_9APHY|nr:PINIT domain-containing protein [Irpex rosettiformis]
MASESVWADFDTVRHNVKQNTVDRLKQIIIGLNDQCGTNFTKSGKKQELIDRVTRELDLWRRANNTEKWVKAKGVLNQARLSLNTYRPNGESSFGHFQASGPPMYHPTTADGVPHYDPYRQQRPPPQAASTSTSATAGIQFKHSPFFRIEKAVSNIVECPESTSQMDRRSQNLTFMMNSEITTKLSSTSTKYQLRLYCTSSTYYSPTSAFRTNLGACPIEFPPTCEVRLNSNQLSANLKGMKKKPGTAPPPDLGKTLRMAPGSSNRIEMIYVNSQQPTPSKKYYLVVMLVEVTTVDQLVDRLRKGKFVSTNEVMAKMFQSATDDDDIIAGHQKMTLKCPLSYVRITTPCRSIKCVHSQCFDALSWFSVMEQTTTWLCPVCEKVLNSEELIVDGYFDSILRATSEDVEDVIVEPDGQWHTADNKFASPEWKIAHPPANVGSLPPTPARRRSPSLVKAVTNGDNHRIGPVASEIVILDSDDEEEGQVKRELSPSVPRTGGSSLASVGSLPPRSQTGESDVIDLTLDSDDDDPPVHASPPKKRKVDDQEVISPTEQVWKKSRADAHPLPPKPVGTSSTPNLSNGSSYISTRDPRVLPSPSTSRYLPRSSVPHSLSSASYIPPGGAPIPSRPPIPRADSYHTPPPRSNGASHWSNQRY